MRRARSSTDSGIKLPEQAGPAIPSAFIFSRRLGPLVFYGLLVRQGQVEIVDFELDLDYWDIKERDPDD